MINKKCQKVSRALSLISSPLRIGIICALSDGEKTVSELVKYTEAASNNLSQHIKILELGGIVRKEKRGHFVVCSLTDRKIFKILKELADCI
jgi:DNA-binding transcriptional ArsR family regulator